MILYFDTSALIKLVIAERGSELAQELWASSHRSASSVLVYAEGRAALAAGRRNGRLSDRLHDEAVGCLDRAHEQLISISVDEQLARLAGGIAAEFALRGYDAVHLATALSLAERDVALVSWDQQLCHAGTAAGLIVLGE
ncbi:MAG TPA: type II toxin-antitoxin system VapC family toxin [Solirubrobacterales bacterium]|nr:type II toxin-antitoxin system VapC family toxin [Solirubrobacterales bacterium]